LNIWHDINPERISRSSYAAVIEISKGSKMKYELDKETGLLRLDRVLYTSTHYPANYGFIPRTYAKDNDPLDVLVLCSEQIQPMSIVECYPIGVISMLDNGAPDDKIISIPFNDPTYNTYKDISQLPAHVFDEMKHFFSVYKTLEEKETAIDEVKGVLDAVSIIEESIVAYKEKFAKRYYILNLVIRSERFLWVLQNLKTECILLAVTLKSVMPMIH
jgi:inorganic pyrophosphatase